MTAQPDRIPRWMRSQAAQTGRPALLRCALAFAVLLVALCAGTATAATPTSYMIQSKKIAALASNGVLWGKATGWVAPTAITPSNANRVEPFKVKPGTKKRSVYFIAQGPTATFRAIDRILSNVGKKLGWKVTTLYADFTPLGLTRQLDAAIRAKPDAIIGGGVPGAVVGQQLAEARKQGIPTVNIDDSGAGGPGWGHYVPGGFNMQDEILGAAIAADSQGTANVVWVDGGAIYAQVELHLVARYLRGCTGCTVTADKANPAVAVDPVKAQQYIASLVRQYPDAQYIVWPFAEPVYGAALQAAASSGSSVKVVTIQGTPTALEAVKSGSAPFVSSYPLTPTILEGVDVLQRVFAGQKRIPTAGMWTAPTSLWRQGGKLPGRGGIKAIEQWTARNSSYNYLGAYGRAWGVNLQSILEGVQ